MSSVVRRSLVVLLVALVLLPNRAAAAVTVRASVDRDQVFVGQPFVLTIEVEGTQKAEPPDLSNLGPFDASYVGPTTRFSSVNGNVTTSVSHRYALTAKNEGSYRLGPFQVRADGNVYQLSLIHI